MNASRILYLNGKPDSWTLGFNIHVRGRGLNSLKRYLRMKGLPFQTAAGSKAWNLRNPLGSANSYRMKAPRLP
jgi:hypothetical protein